MVTQYYLNVKTEMNIYLWSIFHLAVQNNTLVSKLPSKFHQAICVHYVALKIDDKLCNKLYALKFNNHKSRGTKVVWKNEWFEIKFLLAKMLYGISYVPIFSYPPGTPF